MRPTIDRSVPPIHRSIPPIGPKSGTVYTIVLLSETVVVCTCAENDHVPLNWKWLVKTKPLPAVAGSSRSGWIPSSSTEHCMMEIQEKKKVICLAGVYRVCAVVNYC